MYERSRNHIAVGASARPDAPLAPKPSDASPRTQIADRCRSLIADRLTLTRAFRRWEWQKWAAFMMLGLLGLQWSATQSLP